MIHLPNKVSYPLTAAALAFVAACASERVPTPTKTEQPLKPANQANNNQKTISNSTLDGFAWNPRPAEDFNKTMSDYARLDSVLAAARAGDDFIPSQFLATQSNSAMGEMTWRCYKNICWKQAKCRQVAHVWWKAVQSVQTINWRGDVYAV